VGSAPAATSDAEPPDEPPLVRSVSHGLRVTSPPWRSVAAVQPNGGMAVVPIGLSPVARSSGAKGPSRRAGFGGTAREPIVMGEPSTCTLSLNAAGTPAN